MATRAIVVAEVDEVQFGIREIYPLRRRVQGQAVGPVNLGGDDGHALGAVHADPLDARVLAPVGPEEPARVGRRVQTHAARLRDVGAQQRRARAAVLARHLDGVELAVQPVDVAPHPVVREPLHQVEAGRHDDLRLAAAVQARYLLELHVGPEDGPRVHVGGGRDDVLDVDGHALEALLVEVGHEDGVAVGDDEEGAGVVVGLAAVLVGGQAVAGHAGAGVGALGVAAQLRAAARRLALVLVLALAPVAQALAGRAQAQRARRRLRAAVGALAVLARAEVARRPWNTALQLLQRRLAFIT